MPAQHLVATVEQIRNDLAEIPEMDNAHRKISTREAIRSLSEEIRALQKRGHSLESISTMLTEKGIEIKPNTLKMYLRKRASRRQAPSGGTQAPDTKEAPAATLVSIPSSVPAQPTAVRAAK